MVTGVLPCIAKKRNNFYNLFQTFKTILEQIQLYFEIVGWDQCLEI